MGKFEQAPPHTQELVRFICDTKYEDIPREVIENGKGRILDCIGVAYGGGIEPVGKVTRDFVRIYGGCPKATVIGLNLRTDVANAAFANGILMDATDFNDYFILSHPSAGVVPALLPVGELVGASGKDILTAYAVGVEVYTKLNQTMQIGAWKRGFHASGILTTISAVAAAGKLLKLDREQMLMALGIASSTFTGVKKNFGSFTKPYHVGRSVEGGVRSALLASLGFTSHTEAFEGKEGYIDVFCDEPPRWEYLEQLGKVWDMKESPTGIKPQPSCGTTHAPMNGVMEIMDRYHVTEDDVERIDIGFASGVNLGMHVTEPADIYDGKISVHYCVALVLHYHDWGLRYDTDECVQDPAVRKLFPLIHMHTETELDETVDKDHADCHAMVTVTLKDGTIYRLHAQSPDFTYEQIRRKFYDSTCNLNRITKERSDRIADLVLELEKHSIADLIPLID